MRSQAVSDKDAKPSDQQAAPPTWPYLIMLLALLYTCNRRGGDPRAQLDACGKNLHTIGATLEKYRLGTDDGLYPKTLEEAFKGKTLPVCPAGHKGTYVAGYSPSPDRRSYLLVCKGDHHKAAGVPSDYPRISFAAPEPPPDGKSRSTPSPLEEPAILQPPAAEGSPGQRPSPSVEAAESPLPAGAGATPSPSPHP
jgi:hypothetical protein